MPKRCSVPFCDSYAVTHKNLSFFSIPKKSELIKNSWSEVLKCNLTINSVICEKHFKNDAFFDTHFYGKMPDGTVILNVAKLRKRLKPGALPSIEEVDISNRKSLNFEAPNQNVENTNCAEKHVIEVPYKRKRLKEGSLPIIHDQVSDIQSAAVESSNSPSEIDNSVIEITIDNQDSQQPSNSSTDCTQLLNSEVDALNTKNAEIRSDAIIDNEKLPDSFSKTATVSQLNNIDSSNCGPNGPKTVKNINIDSANKDKYLNLVNKLFHEDCNVKLPNDSWNLYKNSRCKNLVFYWNQIIHNPEAPELPIVECNKMISFGNEIKLRIRNKVVAEVDKYIPKKNPHTAEELEEILIKVDSIKLCLGGPPSTSYKDVYTECAYKDGATWRHNKCQLVLENRLVCNHCIHLHQSLGAALDRHFKRFGGAIKKTERTRKRPRYTSQKLTSKALDKKSSHHVKERIRKLKQDCSNLLKFKKDIKCKKEMNE